MYTNVNDYWDRSVWIRPAFFFPPPLDFLLYISLSVWTYGIEQWGCYSHSNIEIIQRYQSKLLRTITNGPWYGTNHNLHSDLYILCVRKVFQERIATHRNAIASHPNLLMAPLLRSSTTRRLKRRWTFDGIHKGRVAERLLDHRQQNQLISS
jgi:hypothetical protein